MIPVILAAVGVGALCAWALSESAESECRRWERESARAREEMQAHDRQIEMMRREQARCEQRARLRAEWTRAKEIADTAYQTLHGLRARRDELKQGAGRLHEAFVAAMSAPYRDRARCNELREARNVLNEQVRRLKGQIDDMYEDLKVYNQRTADLRDQLAG